VDIASSANLEVVDKFCYLGDMLSVDGNADAAVEARIGIGWNKFRQLVPLLTNRDISLIRRGRLYKAVKVKDEVPSKELRESLAIDDIILILQQNRL